MKGFEAVSLAAVVLLCMVLLLLGLPDRYFNAVALASPEGQIRLLEVSTSAGGVKIDESFKSARTLDAVLERYIVKQATIKIDRNP